ncbi:uncharacterized protein LOC123514706 [Portunus trituberculatus]|uniref:uncharacterized protein LOC123514706 n=1 Tax=Portunus trituberculatus TaxID=210409 RepID=UPI001E1CD6CA|nr:uncharacterized protein LOC123514706 [Portunus trituberculatus]
MVSHQLIAEVLLPCEAVQMGLQSVVLKASNQTLCPQLQTQMECSIAETEESRRAEELLSFANSKKSEKLLSVISAAVPSSILPPGCCADLFDIRAGRSGPDDRIYNKHADIRMMIPRGATILEWRSKKSSWSSVVIYGHKKFTGGIGDEDNEQPENNEKWREYFIAEPSEATSVVCMDKLNGEAAHISCRYIDDQFYLIVGSKNVHMLIRGSCDIDQYEGSRYVYAKAIAATVCDTLASLDARKRHLLLSFLHHTRCTLVGEILQEKSQHIVNLSHLTKPQVVIIAMTPTYTGCQEKSLLAVPPHHLLDFCCALGLRTVTYTVIPVTQAMDQKALVRRKIDSEGEVFYYLDKNDDTIGLVKVKTVWYVILRALREKAVYSFTTGKKKSHWDISDCVRSTHKRFTEIQKWLKFSDEYLHSWQNLARNFLHWLNEEVKARKEEPGKIRPAFPMIWNKFLRTTKQLDQIELKFK